MKFDVVVGNIPFTINKNEGNNLDIGSGGSTRIGDSFITLINKLSKKGQACYILPAQYTRTVFKRELILNPYLKKIVHHTKPIFDISSFIRTCHVVLDSNNITDTFEYNVNNSKELVLLNRNAKFVLSKDIESTITLDVDKPTLADIWNNGFRYLNQISNNGKYKVITSLGSYKTSEFQWSYDSKENTSIGKWKVLVPRKGGGRAVKIAGPEFSICFSIIAFEFDKESSAIKFHDWFVTENICDYLNKIRTSGTNTKTLFSYIPLPDGII